MGLLPHFMTSPLLERRRPSFARFLSCPLLERQFRHLYALIKKTRMDTDAILATSVSVSVVVIAIVSFIITRWDELCGYSRYIEEDDLEITA